MGFDGLMYPNLVLCELCVLYMSCAFTMEVTRKFHHSTHVTQHTEHALWGI